MLQELILTYNVILRKILSFLNMVDVAQLAERLVVAQVVVGSSPIIHPSPSGRSADRLARLLWEQEVGSSNLLAPTSLYCDYTKRGVNIDKSMKAIKREHKSNGLGRINP